MNSRLLRQERQERIVDLLEEHGRVSVAALSERFGLSQATIRTDLETLVQEGMIVRTHGGAILADEGGVEISFELRRRLWAVEKKRIGAAAATMIEDGEAIALDASTTALAIADQIRDRRELTVVTNGIYTALALIDSPGVTVFMPGGFLRRDSVSMVGCPRQQRVIDTIKKYSQAKIWYHTCGDCSEYIPDFIEMGIDILNPVQISAPGMDPVKLKGKWGDQIVFWGGGIDSQHVLPFVAPEQVRAEVKKNVEIFKPGGGYVFNNVHNIQAGVPPENVVVMYEAAYESGSYP